MEYLIISYYTDHFEGDTFAVDTNRNTIVKAELVNELDAYYKQSTDIKVFAETLIKHYSDFDLIVFVDHGRVSVVLEPTNNHTVVNNITYLDDYTKERLTSKVCNVEADGVDVHVFCPECGRYFEKYLIYHFCPECGQRIDVIKSRELANKRLKEIRENE